MREYLKMVPLVDQRTVSSDIPESFCFQCMIKCLLDHSNHLRTYRIIAIAEKIIPRQ